MDVLALASGPILAYAGYRILSGLHLTMRPTMRPELSSLEERSRRLADAAPAAFPPYFDIAFNRFLKMFAGITLLTAGISLLAYGLMP